jgi:hypothetical protein
LSVSGFGRVKGFHRIRHYGLLASGARAESIARARQLLAVSAPAPQANDQAVVDDQAATALAAPCPCCGGRMIVIETFEAGCPPRHAPTITIDTS